MLRRWPEVERRLRLSLLFGASAWLLPGCLAEPSVAPVTTLIRDSGGIRIVENVGDFAGLPQWRLLGPPEHSIGSVEGGSAATLFRVLGASRLSDGRIVLLNAGSYEVRFYQADGVLDAAVGRAGSGPGEFRFPFWFGRWRGDTVAAYDVGEQRMSLFAPDGSLLDVQRAPVSLSGLVGFLNRDVVIVLAPQFTRGEGERLLDTPSMARAIDLKTGRIDTLAVVGKRRAFQWHAGDRLLMTPVPFTVHPRIRAHEGEVYLIDGHSPEVHIMAADGSVRRIMRILQNPEPVSPAEFQKAVDVAIAASRDSGYSGDLLRIYRRMPRPEFKPFYDELIVSLVGDIWLRKFDAMPGKTRTWRILDRDGRAIAQAELPSAGRILEAGPGYVLIHEADSLGVEYVRSFRLQGR